MTLLDCLFRADAERVDGPVGRLSVRRRFAARAGVGVEGAEAEAEVDVPESSGARRLAEAPVPLKKPKPLRA